MTMFCAPDTIMITPTLTTSKNLSHAKEKNLDGQEEKNRSSRPPHGPASKNIHALMMMLLDAKDWGAFLQEIHDLSPRELLQADGLFLDHHDRHPHPPRQSSDDDQPDRLRRMMRTTGGSHKRIYDSESALPYCGARVNLLHQACGLSGGGAPSFVIKAICHVNPRILYSTETTYQRSALHIACLNGADFNSVAALLEMDETKKKNHHQDDDDNIVVPRLATMPDVYGRLAIHYAAMDRSLNGQKTLRLLLKAAPSSLMVQDIHGYSPLHIACKVGQPMSMIRLFLLTAPDSIVLQTNVDNNGKREDAAHFARHSTAGVWTPKQQVAIVDYLQNLALVTKITIARQGSCHCSYLGNNLSRINNGELTRSLLPVGEYPKNEHLVLANHEDLAVDDDELEWYNPLRLSTEAPVPHNGRGSSASCCLANCKWTEENNESFSGETCSEVTESEEMSDTECGASLDCRFVDRCDLSLVPVQHS